MAFTTQGVEKFLGTMLRCDVLHIIEECKNLAEKYPDKTWGWYQNQWRIVLNWADNLNKNIPTMLDKSVIDEIPGYVCDFKHMNFKVNEELLFPPLVQYGFAYEKYLQSEEYLQHRKLHVQKEKENLLHFCQLLKNEKYNDAQAMKLDFF